LNISVKNKRNFSLSETLILSVLFHAALLFVMPKNNVLDINIPTELKIDILLEEKNPEIIAPKKKPIPEPIVKPIPEPIPKAMPLEKSTKQNIQSDKNNIAEIKNNIDEYSAKITLAIKKQQKYPRMAMNRNLQGSVIIELKFNKDGSITNSKVKKSSGHKILDKEALNMTKRAMPFPVPPKILQSKVFTVVVPITFTLK
jgi:protein TonB